MNNGGKRESVESNSTCVADGRWEEQEAEKKLDLIGSRLWERNC